MSKKDELAAKRYLAAIGARGGAATSQAKRDAARANGARGGRPRKVKPDVGNPPKPALAGVRKEI